jgi:hypothetical protein
VLGTAASEEAAGPLPVPREVAKLLDSLPASFSSGKLPGRRSRRSRGWISTIGWVDIAVSASVISCIFQVEAER